MLFFTFWAYKKMANFYDILKMYLQENITMLEKKYAAFYSN